MRRPNRVFALHTCDIAPSIFSGNVHIRQTAKQHKAFGVFFGKDIRTIDEKPGLQKEKYMQ